MPAPTAGTECARDIPSGDTPADKAAWSLPRSTYTVTAAEDGSRLDAALGAFFPHMGVRGRRRVWETAAVLVNGKARPHGWLVRSGDVLAVVPRAPQTPAVPVAAPAQAQACGGACAAPVYGEDTTAGAMATTGTLATTDTACAIDTAAGASGDASPRPAVVGRPLVLGAPTMPADMAFVFKPAGLHTAALAGKDNASLERELPRCLPPHVAAQAVLCTRLDFETSGIVAVACTPAAAQLWRESEDAGLCRKFYLAVLTGHMTKPCTATFALDTVRRSTTHVLPMPAPPLRHTHFTPLGYCVSHDIPAWRQGENVPLTLALCCIHKGARHQIRAHAAALGHALWGDTRYGGGETGKFFLHHGMLRVAEGLCACPCPWVGLLPPDWRDQCAHISSITAQIR